MGSILTYITKNVDCHAIMYNIQMCSWCCLCSIVFWQVLRLLSMTTVLYHNDESVRRYLLTRSPSNIDQVALHLHSIIPRPHIPRLPLTLDACLTHIMPLPRLNSNSSPPIPPPPIAPIRPYPGPSNRISSSSYSPSPRRASLSLCSLSLWRTDDSVGGVNASMMSPRRIWIPRHVERKQ